MASLSIPAGLLEGGALHSALRALFLKRFLSGKQEAISIADLAELTASTEEEVEVALDGLESEGLLTKDQEYAWPFISTVIPTSIVINLTVQQGKLHEEEGQGTGKSGEGREADGWDEWQGTGEGARWMRAEVSADGSSETPFTLRIWDIAGEGGEKEPEAVVTQEFDSRENAWKWVDEYKGSPAIGEPFALEDAVAKGKKGAKKK